VIKVHLHAGLMDRNGEHGFEFPLALFAIALMLVFTDPGALSIDHRIGKGKL
jgi:putative oxidoreductase